MELRSLETVTILPLQALRGLLQHQPYDGVSSPIDSD